MLSVLVYSGCLNIVEGLFLIMMMAKHFGFATVTSEVFSIRFRLAVGRLRSLSWASIVCRTLSS